MLPDTFFWKRTHYRNPIGQQAEEYKDLELNMKGGWKQGLEFWGLGFEVFVVLSIEKTFYQDFPGIFGLVRENGEVKKHDDGTVMFTAYSGQFRCLIQVSIFSRL